jgi:hypothetical protein|nr:MAG TPA: hypothetical protein [Bacteriophage sp.]
MNPIMIAVIGLLLFLLVCFIVRKKKIELPGYDRVDNSIVILMILGTCIAWLITLPVEIVVFIGLIITRGNEEE